MRWITAKPFVLSDRDESILGLRKSRLLLEDRYMIGEKFRRALHLASLPPDLFLKFARTPITESAILAFALKYSLLNGDTLSHVNVLDEEGRISTDTAESFTVWRAEIMWMRFAIELWEVLQLNGLGLEKYVTWSDDRITVRDLEGKVVFRRPTWAYSKPLKHADKIGMVEHSVMSIVKSQLHGRIKAGYPFHNLKLELEPTGLIGALWLQLVRAIEEKAYLKKCVVCGKHFKTNRRDPETCPGSKCRKEKSRRQKRQTHLLRLISETPDASWEKRLERWETWRKDSPDLLKIKTPDLLKSAYEAAKNKSAHELES